MLLQSREIIDFLSTLDPEMDGDLKASLLEKKLDEIFIRERFQGCYIREIDDHMLNINHPSCTLEAIRTGSNSFNIILKQ